MKFSHWICLLLFLAVGVFIGSKKKPSPQRVDSAPQTPIGNPQHLDTREVSEPIKSLSLTPDSPVESLTPRDSVEAISPPETSASPSLSESIPPMPSPADALSNPRSKPIAVPQNTSASSKHNGEVPAMPIPSNTSGSLPPVTRPTPREGSSASSSANAVIPPMPNPNK